MDADLAADELCDGCGKEAHPNIACEELSGEGAVRRWRDANWTKERWKVHRMRLRALRPLHVYKVGLNDREMAKLETLARRRGVPPSVVLRELIQDAAALQRARGTPKRPRKS